MGRPWALLTVETHKKTHLPGRVKEGATDIQNGSLCGAKVDPVLLHWPNEMSVTHLLIAAPCRLSQGFRRRGFSNSDIYENPRTLLRCRFQLVGPEKPRMPPED